ncbi:hypothetical protein [Nodularia spumigena]|uniref:hypothetical protein n=1 Tax=Nodularia spumigena TaxID=70799 RepID=UPI00232C27ED|nr:hypothetical protein [Nodularia spumigena]
MRSPTVSYTKCHTALQWLPIIRFNSQPCRSTILQSSLPETAFIEIAQPIVFLVHSPLTH